MDACTELQNLLSLGFIIAVPLAFQFTENLYCRLHERILCFSTSIISVRYARAKSFPGYP